MINQANGTIIKIEPPIRNSRQALQQKVFIKEIGPYKRTTLTFFQNLFQKLRECDKSKVYTFNYITRADPYSRFGTEYKNVESFSEFTQNPPA
jgi:hypothetical protein